MSCARPRMTMLWLVGQVNGASRAIDASPASIERAGRLSAARSRLIRRMSSAP